MEHISFEIYQKKVIIKIRDKVCETPEELLSSPLCREILKRFLNDLDRKKSLFLNIFPKSQINTILASPEFYFCWMVLGV